ESVREENARLAYAATVDFDFAVHTYIGRHFAGANDNGRLVPLDYRISNGEFVEILTSKNATPSKDWLKFVKTSRARSKIRSWLKEQEREDIVERGRQMLEKELKRLGIEVKETLKPDRMAEVLKRYGYGAVDDL